MTLNGRLRKNLIITKKKKNKENRGNLYLKDFSLHYIGNWISHFIYTLSTTSNTLLSITKL